MPLDLEGLGLIDMMLDAVVELRLMPDVWLDKERAYLEKIHNSVLRLNRHWENWDFIDLGGLEIMSLRNILASIVGYAELLGLSTEDKKSAEIDFQLHRLERLGKLMKCKADYLNTQVLRDY